MTTYVRKVEVPSKVVYYKGDGTGRDSYIQTINGGLLTQDRLHALIPKPVAPVDSMQFQKKKYHRTLPPKIPQKFPNYHSDGSGRDHYVCINNGGSSDTSYHWRNQVDYKFNAELRQYATIATPAQRDIWTDLQQSFRNQKNPRQLSAERGLAKTQMGLTMRLSTPNNNNRTMSATRTRPSSACRPRSASVARRLVEEQQEQVPSCASQKEASVQKGKSKNVSSTCSGVAEGGIDGC